MPRRALVATACCLLALGFAAGAPAQTPAPQAGPSLQIAGAALTQAGPELQLRVRFSRDVPVAQIDASKARFICVGLGALVRTRRVCVGRRAGRLRASVSPTGPDGVVEGPSVELRRARVAIAGAVLTLHVAAASLHVRLGRTIVWQAFVTWKDGGPCEVAAGPQPCTQVV
ncbi:MAG: hypothetical protein QOI73_2078, partial [Solirubrobacteraceae bacterium]|nr:hypothetical protein [Solirubrobacteraceae bacterium]